MTDGQPLKPKSNKIHFTAKEEEKREIEVEASPAETLCSTEDLGSLRGEPHPAEPEGLEGEPQDWFDWKEEGEVDWQQLVTRPKPKDTGNFTTIMLGVVPQEMTIQQLLDVLNQWGYRRKYDFVYLPIDFVRHVNNGHAFINFRAPADAWKFKNEFEGMKDWPTGRGRRGAKTSYAIVQGYAANIANQQRTSATSPNIPDDYKPWVFDVMGNRIPSSQVFKPLPGRTRNYAWEAANADVKAAGVQDDIDPSWAWSASSSTRRDPNKWEEEAPLYGEDDYSTEASAWEQDWRQKQGYSAAEARAWEQKLAKQDKKDPKGKGKAGKLMLEKELFGKGKKGQGKGAKVPMEGPKGYGKGYEKGKGWADEKGKGSLWKGSGPAPMPWEGMEYWSGMPMPGMPPMPPDFATFMQMQAAMTWWMDPSMMGMYNAGTEWPSETPQALNESAEAAEPEAAPSEEGSETITEGFVRSLAAASSPEASEKKLLSLSAALPYPEASPTASLGSGAPAETCAKAHDLHDELDPFKDEHPPRSLETIEALLLEALPAGEALPLEEEPTQEQPAAASPIATEGASASSRPLEEPSPQVMAAYVRYQCLRSDCAGKFAKWSACLLHLRENPSCKEESMKVAGLEPSDEMDIEVMQTKCKTKAPDPFSMQ